MGHVGLCARSVSWPLGRSSAGLQLLPGIHLLISDYTDRPHKKTASHGAVRQTKRVVKLARERGRK